jgi:hypothetical protein
MGKQLVSSYDVITQLYIRNQNYWSGRAYSSLQGGTVRWDLKESAECQ